MRDGAYQFLDEVPTTYVNQMTAGQALNWVSIETSQQEADDIYQINFVVGRSTQWSCQHMKRHYFALLNTKSPQQSQQG